jgi:hypothetical protein
MKAIILGSSKGRGQEENQMSPREDNVTLQKKCEQNEEWETV